ncbi:hypothetical protein [Halalkalicoccus jeotgali]|uniref:Uncharacterized protein n=1 Tax=Halalkalicoccus jeotgali (strain DSM 18796 / CECT 7217 / JCM 14584 / KCTC 4019 / B3) TaxID=795797 RepID=D8J4L8_HALJB|nr:hypothetical protein HacjB3_00935 [Halalkalicoccus jeotgali B3]
MSDAFGRMVADFHHGRLVEQPVYRRDDGHVSEAHLAGYFADYGEWSDFENGWSSTLRDRSSMPVVGSAGRRCGHGNAVTPFSESTGAPARSGSPANEGSNAR